MAASPTLNERAQRLADHMASTAGALRIGVQPTTGGGVGMTIDERGPLDSPSF